MAQGSVVCTQLDLGQLIAVQINKGNMLFGEIVLEPTFKKYKLRVPLVPRAFSHGDRESTKPPEALRGGSDQNGMGIDIDARYEVHNIWL